MALPSRAQIQSTKVILLHKHWYNNHTMFANGNFNVKDRLMLKHPAYAPVCHDPQIEGQNRESLAASHQSSFSQSEHLK